MPGPHTIADNTAERLRRCCGSVARGRGQLSRSSAQASFSCERIRESRRRPVTAALPMLWRSPPILSLSIADPPTAVPDPTVR